MLLVVIFGESVRELDAIYCWSSGDRSYELFPWLSFPWLSLAVNVQRSPTQIVTELH